MSILRSGPAWYVCQPQPSRLKQNGCVIHCSSRWGSDSNEVDGDSGVQEMLVEMIQIQVGKVHMSDFVDERSEHLRKVAKDVTWEHHRIAYRTMKGLDATGSSVLRRLDADANAIEKDLQIVRAEIEAWSKDFEEFQIRSAYRRNEALFFKNLYRPSTPSLYGSGLSKATYEKKLTAMADPSAKAFSRSYRQVLYGGLSMVLASFMWSSGTAFLSATWMRPAKIASYGLIFSLLLAQLAYVDILSVEDDNDSKPGTDINAISESKAKAPMEEDK